ncbi:hypothetical protein ACFFHM_17195 [Halalkalibacter kiskunsagensis]|uniref:Cytochrome c oxidase subunit 2A n=1 Tax=Halalkalibacter kiskunsagensis TaxID=1548599 RepID=A0ABV6KFT9_9BACI
MEAKKNKQEAIKDHGTRVGTWFSLGVVAAVILGTYVLMFSVYLARV